MIPYFVAVVRRQINSKVFYEAFNCVLVDDEDDNTVRDLDYLVHKFKNPANPSALRKHRIKRIKDLETFLSSTDNNVIGVSDKIEIVDEKNFNFTRFNVADNRPNTVTFNIEMH